MKAKTLIETSLILSMLLTGCGATQTDTTKTKNNTHKSNRRRKPPTKFPKKEVVIYFANWHQGSKAADEGGEGARTSS